MNLLPNKSPDMTDCAFDETLSRTAKDRSRMSLTLRTPGGRLVVARTDDADLGPIPTVPYDSPAPAEEVVKTEVPHPRRVLVVDDNRDLAESLAVVLRLWGHDVVVAYDGPEALESAQERPPEVVFLDIGLPHLDGFEVARRMRADPVMRHARIVAITGYGRDEDYRRSQEVGIDLHLTKPVDPIVLQPLLRG
jgi:CheY-like chemotaxis protein